MESDVLSPEERELRSLIRIEWQPDGSFRAIDIDPERCTELRRLIMADTLRHERAFEAQFGDLASTTGPEAVAFAMLSLALIVGIGLGIHYIRTKVRA
jgi:hypothetical protein